MSVAPLGNANIVSPSGGQALGVVLYDHGGVEVARAGGQLGDGRVLKQLPEGLQRKPTGMFAPQRKEDVVPEVSAKVMDLVTTCCILAGVPTPGGSLAHPVHRAVAEEAHRAPRADVCSLFEAGMSEVRTWLGTDIPGVSRKSLDRVILFSKCFRAPVGCDLFGVQQQDDRLKKMVAEGESAMAQLMASLRRVDEAVQHSAVAEGRCAEVLDGMEEDVDVDASTRPLVERLEGVRDAQRVQLKDLVEACPYDADSEEGFNGLPRFGKARVAVQDTIDRLQDAQAALEAAKAEVTKLKAENSVLSQQLGNQTAKAASYRLQRDAGVERIKGLETEVSHRGVILKVKNNRLELFRQERVASRAQRASLEGQVARLTSRVATLKREKSEIVGAVQLFGAQIKGWKPELAKIAEETLSQPTRSGKRNLTACIGECVVQDNRKAAKVEELMDSQEVHRVEILQTRHKHEVAGFVGHAAMEDASIFYSIPGPLRGWITVRSYVMQDPGDLDKGFFMESVWALAASFRRPGTTDMGRSDVEVFQYWERLFQALPYIINNGLGHKALSVAETAGLLESVRLSPAAAHQKMLDVLERQQTRMEEAD